MARNRPGPPATPAPPFGTARRSGRESSRGAAAGDEGTRRREGGTDPAVLGRDVLLGLVVVRAFGDRLHAGQRGWVGPDPRSPAIVLRIGKEEQGGGIGAGPM